MESIKYANFQKTHSIQNDIEVKESKHLSTKCVKGQLSTNSEKLHLLHNPSDINHIHGLRNRLFMTFNEFAKILENALLPPVLKNTKKVKIKIKEFDQQSNKDYISDLDKLVSEIKKQFKNENLHDKKNKNSVNARKDFQTKLIGCYKLAINATKMCSQTLEAGIYCPIQNKMKKLIKIISVLSLTTGKYIYGELFKKKKKESFDVIERCKTLENMLNECGYEDTENEINTNQTEIKCNNTLNELTSKALSRAKTPSFSTNNKRLSMYNHSKPKLGSSYAQEWSKKTLDLAKYKTIDDKYQNSLYDRVVEYPLNRENNLDSDNMSISHYNLDNIKTAIQDHQCPHGELNSNEENKFSFQEVENKNLNCFDEFSNLPSSSEMSNELKKTNNVGLYIFKENIWRNFPLKNINLSQNGCLLLNISTENMNSICSYRTLFRQSSLVSKDQVDTVYNIIESTMEDLVNEVLSKINFDSMVNELIIMELSK